MKMTMNVNEHHNENDYENDNKHHNENDNDKRHHRHHGHHYSGHRHRSHRHHGHRHHNCHQVVIKKCHSCSDRVDNTGEIHQKSGIPSQK